MLILQMYNSTCTDFQEWTIVPNEADAIRKHLPEVIYEGLSDMETYYYEGKLDMKYASEGAMYKRQKKRWKDRKTLKALRTDYVGKRVEYYHNLLAISKSIPKEYMSRMQKSKAYNQSELSALEGGTTATSVSSADSGGRY